jgi:hypothetical protein
MTRAEASALASDRPVLALGVTPGERVYPLIQLVAARHFLQIMLVQLPPRSLGTMLEDLTTQSPVVLFWSLALRGQALSTNRRSPASGRPLSGASSLTRPSLVLLFRCLAPHWPGASSCIMQRGNPVRTPGRAFSVGATATLLFLCLAPRPGVSFARRSPGQPQLPGASPPVQAHC